MTAEAVISGEQTHGLRQVSLRNDLGGIADLLELCFGPTMDDSGRAAIREMRMISRSGSLSLLFHGLDQLVGGLGQGFVWLEDGRIVGNVSVSPTHYPRSLGKTFIIANVAVHPDFRRRGMAEVMMRAAMDMIRQKGGRAAILQVEHQNDTAQRLYLRLGFHEERVFTRWYRSSLHRAPEKAEDMPFMTMRQFGDWWAEYQLAEQVRPQRYGGMGWLRPTHPETFRPSLLGSVGAWMVGRSDTHVIVRDEQKRGVLRASLRITSTFGGADKLEMLIRPVDQGRLEDPLINYALRRLDNRRAVSMEHPADDTAATEVLKRYHFEARQTLMHMRYEF
jgi:GNAT superfamily N-acetyltransferase